MYEIAQVTPAETNPLLRFDFPACDCPTFLEEPSTPTFTFLHNIPSFKFNSVHHQYGYSWICYQVISLPSYETEKPNPT